MPRYVRVFPSLLTSSSAETAGLWLTGRGLCVTRDTADQIFGLSSGPVTRYTVEISSRQMPV